MGTGLARLARYTATGEQGLDDAPARPVTGLARFDRYIGMPDFSNVESGASTSAPEPSRFGQALRETARRALRVTERMPNPLAPLAVAGHAAVAGGKMAGRDVAEHGVRETLADIGRGINLGGEESLAATLIGASDLIGADEVADRLRANREKLREEQPIRTRSGQAAHIASRVATDIGQFYATGAVGGAALGAAAKGAEAAGLARTATTLGRIAAPATKIGRAARDVALAAPVNAAIGADRESSTLGVLADVTKSPTLQRAAESPALRAAAEIGVDAVAASVLQLFSRSGKAKLASEAAARKVAPPQQLADDAARRARREAEIEDAVNASETQARGEVTPIEQEPDVRTTAERLADQDRVRAEIFGEDYVREFPSASEEMPPSSNVEPGDGSILRPSPSTRPKESSGLPSTANPPSGVRTTETTSPSNSQGPTASEANRSARAREAGVDTNDMGTSQTEPTTNMAQDGTEIKLDLPALGETTAGRTRVAQSAAYRAEGALPSTGPEARTWHQPAETAQALHDLAAEVKPEYDATIETWGKELAGDDFVRVETTKPKSVQGLIEKATKRKHRPVNQIGDVLRGSIITRDIASAKRVVEGLRARGLVLELDDLHAAPTPHGYSAYHLQVPGPKGMIAELQVHTAAEWDARAKLGGHDVYDRLEKPEYWRSLDTIESAVDDLEYVRETYMQAHEAAMRGEVPGFRHEMHYDFDRKRWTITDARGKVVSTMPEGTTAREARAVRDELDRVNGGAPTETTPTRAGSAPEVARRQRPPPTGSRREVGPRLAGVDGADDSVTLPDNTRYAVRYRVVEARDLAPSHNAESFAPRADYPAGVQGRRYHTDRSAQENTVQGAQKLNPERLIRDTGNAGGTPIITPDGIVLAGNQRAMMLQRAAALHPDRMGAYRAELTARAQRFGIDPATLERMEHPVLVREVTDPALDVADLQTLRTFNDLSDTPTQKARSTTDEAMARAARLRQAPAALEHFTTTIQPDETLRAYLDSSRGTAFVRTLVEDGVLRQQEAARFLDVKRGALTADGRNLIEQMMYAAAVGSPDILDRAPRDILNRMDAALPAIIRAGEVEGWALQEPLQDALDLLKRVRDLKAEGKGITSVRDLMAQGSLLGDDAAGKAELMAEFLEGTRKKSDIAEAFRRYAAEAEAAERATQSYDVFGYQPPAPDAVFAKVFSGDIPNDPALRMGADSPLHPGWSLATAPGPTTRSLVPPGPTTREAAERILRDPKEAFLAKHGMASPQYREAERLLNVGNKMSAGEVARQAAERKASEGSRDLFIEGQGEMFGDAPPPAAKPKRTKEDAGQGALFLAPRARNMASETLPDAAPFGQGTRATEAPHRAIERVTRALNDAMGLVTREGKVRGMKGAVGIFKPVARVIRTKNAADVGVFAHEMGHALHELFFGTAKRGLTDAPLAPFAHELRPLAAGISDESVAEGWAEFWRRWIDNPQVAEQKAPTTWAYVNRRLHEEFPGVEQALLEARERWQTFREANAQSRIFAQISQKASARHFSIRDALARRRTEVLDDFAPIQRVVDALTDGKPRPEEDAALLARLVRGSHGTAEHFLERGTLDFGTLKQNGASLAEVLEPVKDRLDKFRVYLVARRAHELIGRGIETGLRAEDVNIALTQLGAEKGFQRAAEALYQYQDRVLNYLRDAGVIRPETVDKMRRVNQSYVPFFRVRDDQAGLSGRSMVFGHLFNPTKRIKGSGREIIDPLESIIKNTYAYVHLAQKQQVSEALARLARRPAAGQFIERIATPMVPTRVGTQEITDWLADVLGERFGREGAGAARDLGAMLSELDQQDMLAIFRPGDYFKAENMISVLDRGKRVWYQVNPELYQALMGLDKEHVGLWAALLAKPAALLRAGATLAPEFIGRNPVRDQLTAFVQSEYGFKPGIDLAQGLFSALKKDELYWRWKAAGGEGAALVDLDRKSLRAKLVQATQEKTTRQKIGDVVLGPLRGLQALSAFMENATRLGEFRRALAKEGTSKTGLQRSAAAAREVSTDFARHGAKTTNLRLISAFWNARLQGYDRLFRAFRRRPMETTAKAAAAITVPSIALFYLNKNDDDYWEIPQWQRDIFWHIPTGKDETGHTKFLRLPKPFELGIIFGTIPERILEWVHSHDATGLEKTLKQLMIGGAGESIPVPTAILPLIENYFNYSVFRGRPIVPRGLEEAHGRDQGTDRNSVVARKLGAMLDYSPAKIDNLIFGYSAGLGQLALRDIPAGVDRLTSDVAKPDATASDIPGLRGFAVRRAGASSESVERFYEARARAREDRASLNLLKRQGDADEFTRRQPALQEGANQARFFDQVADELAELRNRKRDIERDPVMSGAEKRRRLNEIDDQIVERAASALNRRTPATGARR